MRKNLFKFLHIVLIAVFLQATHASAAPASKEDAVAFVKKAIAYIKTHGKEKAFAEFNNKDGQFFDREMYVTCLTMDGVALVNGYNPKIVGKPLFELRDMNGKYFVKEEIEIAKTKGKGWVDFEWNHPITKKMEKRTIYLETIDNSYYCLTGVYTD